MAVNNDWKSKIGVVYSTNPDFEYSVTEPDEAETLPAKQQKLRVHFERAGRGGKTATIVAGFQGSEDDLSALGRVLKSKLGIGGAVKGGEIILQGDVRLRVVELLKSLGYAQSR